MNVRRMIMEVLSREESKPSPIANATPARRPCAGRRQDTIDPGFNPLRLSKTMGSFSVGCRIENVVDRSKSVTVRRVLVDK
jgi:hypothetical protein